MKKAPACSQRILRHPDYEILDPARPYSPGIGEYFVHGINRDRKWDDHKDLLLHVAQRFSMLLVKQGICDRAEVRHRVYGLKGVATRSLRDDSVIYQEFDEAISP